MSFGTQYDTKEQIRQAVDIVDLVGSYLPLRREGRGFAALCPWHDDSRPSLRVNPQRQSWKCWVCDIGGDVFSFVERREGVSFREAMQILADRAGISLGPARPAAAPGSAQDKSTLYKAVAWAEQQYHQCLRHDPQAGEGRDYLQRRGISAESIEKFHLGFAPDGWQWLSDRARQTSFTTEVLINAGLLAKSQAGRAYDVFRGRVMFPIRDAQHRPIAFGGRVLPSNQDPRAAKYINTSETSLFNKSEQLYGLDQVLHRVGKSGQLVVVEGYTDVVMAHQHDQDDVVAVLGTALGQQHIRVLRRFADRVCLVLDGDAAGQRRTNEILELFVSEQMDLRILTLPENLDPCDFLIQRGGEAFRSLLEGAVDALEHKIRSATDGIDVNDTHRAHQALEDILATMAKAPVAAGGAGQATRLRVDLLLGRLARQFRMELDPLRQRLGQLRRTPRGDRQPPETAGEVADVSWQPLQVAERELLEVLVLQPDLAAAAVRDVRYEDLSSNTAQQIYTLYEQAVNEDLPLDIEHLITHVEDAQLKYLLVNLQDGALDKADHSTETPSERLAQLVQAFQSRALATEMGTQVEELTHGNYDEQEELAALHKLIEHQRKRQGISAPTDG